jgi:hypothetical protein
MPSPSEKSDFRERKYRVPSKKAPSSIREVLKKIAFGSKKEGFKYRVPQKRRGKVEEKAEPSKKEEKPSLLKGGHAQTGKLKQEIQKYERYSRHFSSVKERGELPKKWFGQRIYISHQDIEKVRKDIEKRSWTTDWSKGKAKVLEEKKLFESFFPKKKP